MPHNDDRNTPAGWDGLDTSTPPDVDPASAARVTGAQEVAPGVYLVPGGPETEANARARAEGDAIPDGLARDRVGEALETVARVMTSTPPGASRAPLAHAYRLLSLALDPDLSSPEEAAYDAL